LAPAPERPLLWSLECTFAEGGALEGLAREERTLVHRQEPGCRAPPPFTVGRAAQEDFFRAALPAEATRRVLSREHFQVWAAEAPPPAGAEGRAGLACCFFLTNLGGSWTTVNGTLLDARGKYTQLLGGDTIALGGRVASAEGVRYTPFLQFRFELRGSVLREAEAAPALAAEPGPSLTGLRRGTCLAGSVVPLFLLEAGGSGLREGLEPERRVIVHGPAVEEPAAGRAFAALALGRGHGTWFWRQLLREEAFRALEWEQALLQPAEGEEGQALLRSLSAACPPRVRGRSGGRRSPRARALEPDERRVLRDGDVISLLPDGPCSLCLTFRDLSAPWPATVHSTACAAAQPGAATPRPGAGGA